jgi:hypothetical protein
MTITATTETEDMVITYEAETERSDYGVPGSPVWYEIVDVEVVGVEIMGVEVDPKTLPKELIGELREMAPVEDSDGWS